MDGLLARTNLPILVVALLLTSASDAWAYIDPGTGSYVFQLLIAGGLAGLYTVRRHWFTVKTSLISKFRRGANDNPSRTNGVE
jgi:hypothetical protein